MQGIKVTEPVTENVKDQIRKCVLKLYAEPCETKKADGVPSLHWAGQQPTFNTLNMITGWWFRFIMILSFLIAGSYLRHKVTEAIKIYQDL